MKTLKQSLLLFMCLAGPVAYGQTTISGRVVDAANDQPLIGVNIIVQETVVGTVTNQRGEFNLKVKDAPPMTLLFSFIGYEEQKVDVSEPGATDLSVRLQETSLLGNEIVISASRIEENILQSPVSIEKMDILDVRESPSFSYYQTLKNLKTVDVSTSSIGFQVYNARGFYTTGNERMVQLIDGMDSQAPGLNFPISNLNGPSELDIESVEFIPGAASALYGPNAFNGVILINSKNPFHYPGLSATVKYGYNHLNSAATSAKPIYEGAVRYAKSFNDKLAFKVNFSYFQAEDWYGTDYTDQNAINQGDLSVNPGYNGLHTHGDEAGINLGLLRTSADVQNGLGLALFQQNAEQFGNDINNAVSFAGAYTSQLPVIQVNRTPYEERFLVDYGAQNLKASAALHYRLTDRLETSYTFNYGSGTSVYTGSNRYSLNDFFIHQHKLELKSNHFLLKAYTTQENSGDSYDATFSALSVNSDWRNNNEWFGTYAVAYGAGLVQATGGNPALVSQLPAEVRSALHVAAREQADEGRLLPGSGGFSSAFEQWKNEEIPVGSKFNDRTNLYHAEAQYDFKEQIDFVDVIAGVNYRLFDLNSNGTIFPDTAGNNLSIYEYGAFVQASKKFMNNKLKLTGSLRYDKNQNFAGQVNPRISGVYSVARNHNFRASYQTGFRLPSTQEQHIDLFVGAYRLLGGLPQYADRYDVTTNTYTILSINDFANSVFSGAPDPSLLQAFDRFEPLKPERVQSFEVGYKGLIANKLFFDISYYNSRYENFIGQTRIRRAAAPVVPGAEGVPAALSLLDPSAPTYQIYLNSDEIVNAHGFAVGGNLIVGGSYELGLNYNFNELRGDIDDSFITTFNTPKHKVNASFGNRNVINNVGFNVAWRWQDAFYWESSFALGNVPAYQTTDAKITYKMPSANTVLAIGGSNIFNKWHIQNYGGPSIGGVYYVSVTFDEFLN